MKEHLNMLPTVALGMVLGGFFLLWWNHCSPTWRAASKSGARIPKGSFGWPIIGESIELAVDHAAYASSHFKRYGAIFKSSLSFQKVIIGTTPEFAKFVTTNSNLFMSRGPVNTMDTLGRKSFMFKDGPPHLSVKKLLQMLIQPETLRSQVNALENIICENMSSWEQKGTIVGKHEAEKIMLEASIWLILGVRESESPLEIRKAKENFQLLTIALASLPLNLPGTTFNKGLRAEQQAILKTKDLTTEGPRLYWEDTKKMVYAQKFYQELHRTVAMAPVVTRQATEDVEFEGHLIPKGWGMWPMYKIIHSDPGVYPDPQSFNPDRFDMVPKPFTYLPFSAGPHMCPGMEFSKLISLIFIHHLTTTFIFESASLERGVEYTFFPVPKGGYPINIHQRNNYEEAQFNSFIFL